MRFRKDAKLDPSQVEDYRGRGGGLPGGIPMKLGGGGGIGVLLVVLAFMFLGGGGGLGDLGSLAAAEQRQSWFVRGIEASGPQSCDTFEGRV